MYDSIILVRETVSILAKVSKLSYVKVQAYCNWILYFMAILAIYHLKKAEKPYLGSWYNLRCMEPDQSYAEQNFEHILWIKYSGTAGQLSVVIRVKSLVLGDGYFCKRSLLYHGYLYTRDQ